MHDDEFVKSDEFDKDWHRGKFFRHMLKHGWASSIQARRGDMQPIILGMLQDGPKHGYEVIRTLEEKSHGMWRPSPGSIYPTLQLLEDEDMVTSEEKGGKKVYSLTDKGREAAEKSVMKGPWETDEAMVDRMKELHHPIIDLMHEFKHVLKHGSEEDFERAKSILVETRDKLKSLRPHEE